MWCLIPSSSLSKNEIKYSLKTNNYFDALSKLRIENAKIEMFFGFVRDLAMDIKNKAIILTDDDLDRVLAYRLPLVMNVAYCMVK